MQVSIFCALGLIKPIHVPQNWGFGGFDPLNGEWQQRDPQKSQPCEETRRVTYGSSKSVYIRAMAQRYPKNRERKKEIERKQIRLRPYQNV